MKKIVKIKESQILGIISNILSEQATAIATKEVSASGELGTDPTFDGLKTLLKDLKNNIEKELRGEIPYKVKNGGVKFSRSGNSLNISVSLEQCEPEVRYWYFDVSAAVFSYATDDTSLRSALDNKLIEKARYFGGIPNSKKHILKTNFINVSTLKNIDPKNPEKTYNMLIGYVVGEMPEGVQTLPGEAPIQKAQGVVEPPKVADQPQKTEPTTSTTTPVSKPEPAKQENANVTRSLSGSFQSSDGDSAHNFKELETKIGAALTEMYNKGTNPKINSVTAKITKKGAIFTTSYSATIGPSNDGKAWMGFTARGSYGNGYVNRADGQISGTENEDGRSLEAKLKGIGAGEVEIIGKPYVDASVPVKEYFIQFTKPSKFPPHQ